MNDPQTHAVEEQLVRVPAGPAALKGNLTLPEEARAVVLFAHGSGSSRHGPRNRYVARVLNEAKLTMLLIDVLTVNEEPSICARDNCASTSSCSKARRRDQLARAVSRC